MIAGGNTYHPRARKGVPAETNAISLLDLVPLVLERFVVHLERSRATYARNHFYLFTKTLGDIRARR
jgi:hypothetical protein